jgi:hypothetical protein
VSATTVTATTVTTTTETTTTPGERIEPKILTGAV